MVAVPVYRAHEADEHAWDSALRPKQCLLAVHRRLRDIVASKLMLDWSPEQISGWLKTAYPDDESMHVSHETIYRSLFIQARGVLKKELMDHLRSKRRMRRSRHATVSGQSRGQIVDAISIRERPAEVEDRAIPGHWEGDLLSGAKNSYIATLVERHSRFAMLIKVPSKETEAVVAALSQHVRKLPATLRRSLTWDRGLEMAKHKDFTVATDVQVYFCDPQSPWQRGTNENTNLLLRQYFPRGTDLSGYSQAQLDQVALRLNQRPRKTLGFQTPASRLQASVVELSMAIAIVAALAIREIFTALVITLFVLVAEILEGLTVSRGRTAIRHLVGLLPTTATVRRNDKWQEVQTKQIAVGDIVLVKPGARIPVDGLVAGGHSFVDQATITGESMPVEKTKGSAVYAGTINQSGALEIRLDRMGRDTTFGKIIDAVERAEKSRAPIQGIADRLAGYLVYFALGAAVVTFLVTHNVRSTISVIIVAGACGIAADTSGDSWRDRPVRPAWFNHQRRPVSGVARNHRHDSSR